MKFFLVQCNKQFQFFKQQQLFLWHVWPTVSSWAKPYQAPSPPPINTQLKSVQGTWEEVALQICLFISQYLASNWIFLGSRILFLLSNICCVLMFKRRGERLNRVDIGILNVVSSVSDMKTWYQAISNLLSSYCEHWELCLCTQSWLKRKLLTNSC